MKRKLRVSGEGDYIAIDLVDEVGMIKKTPFYLTPKKSVKIKVYDFEESKWYEAEAVFLGLTKVSILCEDGLDYDEPLEGLLNEKAYKFINQ